MRWDAASELIYTHLKKKAVERLNRGMVLVERETKFGLRRGLLVGFNLEDYSPECKKGAIFCATTDTLPQIVASRYEMRRRAILEFPHTVFLYRDKKDKVLNSLRGDLEEIYNFTLYSGERLKGYFIPMFEAMDLADLLLSRADSFFVVADGNHSLAAAKRHWEEQKAPLSPSEAEFHPARFSLAEFVNVLEDAVAFDPIHRVIKETDPKAFCEFFQDNCKCKREGSILYPILSDAESYQKVDEAIGRFLQQSSGRVEYRVGRPKELKVGEDCAVVALPAIEKEEVFEAAKSGKRYPAKTFCLAGESARCCVEGKEISFN